LSELHTISDSKEAFYKEFPYVIPHVFRKLADEILVELHLLSHQNEFKRDSLFAIGLTQSFNELTKGYKPKDHLEKLFNALCNCNNIDPQGIQKSATNALLTIDSLTTEDLRSYTNSKENRSQVLLNLFDTNKIYYSRLTILGVLSIVSKIVNKDNQNEDQGIEKLTLTISEDIGFPKERIERDISLYLSSIDRLKQSLELIKLINKK
tara:strand:+ start:346 stop:969 length:624 start_codon:yes stop_codon:yes gene_type:complete